MAFLVKAPYAFYLLLPLAVFAWRGPRARSALVLAAAVSASVAALSIWRAHADFVSSGAPDWSFIPGYFKFVNMGAWYYGPLSMRWDPQVWSGLALRFHEVVATPFGSVLFFAGVVASARATVKGAWWRVAPLWAWLVGVLAYVAIFLKLNVVHVYYQIPLLAVTAVFIAIATDVPTELIGQRHRAAGLACSLALFMVFAGGAVATAERNFYKDEGMRVEAGEVIRRHTPPGSLIIAAEDSPDTDCRDPRLLFEAQRSGWTISKRDLTSDLLGKYRGIGADYLAVLSESGAWAGEFQGCTMVGYPLGHRPWVVQHRRACAVPRRRIRPGSVTTLHARVPGLHPPERIWPTASSSLFREEERQEAAGGQHAGRDTEDGDLPVGTRFVGARPPQGRAWDTHSACAR